MRARIDVSEIEAQTKIRAKYLRALENEEWDLLPGPTFVRSFLRTYAQALGLDAKALVDEYRMSYEQPSELDHQPVMSPPRRTPARSSSEQAPWAFTRVRDRGGRVQSVDRRADRGVDRSTTKKGPNRLRCRQIRQTPTKVTGRGAAAMAPNPPRPRRRATRARA